MPFNTASWRLYCLLLACITLLSGCKQNAPIATRASCLTAVSGPVAIAGGRKQLGARDGYSEEYIRAAVVADFDIDPTEVTNAQFAQFVGETGYVTTAETVQPGFDVPGGAVFKEPTATSPTWWTFVEGANWRHPTGPSSSIEGRGAHPVVQVSLADAKAYAAWAGRAIPTEAQWETAAKAGSTTRFVWGTELTPEDTHMANTWQGAFPLQNTAKDGFSFSAPVGCFPANEFGLYDMIGNVWEWTTSAFNTPAGPATIKGGSFLCAPNYCARYRAAARQPQERDLSTNHIGFRTVSAG